VQVNMHTSICVLFLIGVMYPGQISAEHCFPGMHCWPQAQDFFDFTAGLEGDAIYAANENYKDEVVMINTRLTRFPYVIIMAQSLDDVVRSVIFAKKYNIRITVRSSGHDYIGRSTADGSLQINLKKMTKLKFDLTSDLNPAGILTAESGNSWLRVYNETHMYNRSIVGGSAHTVSMGGYTLGGGHSPIGRKFGMAVDNLLSVKMVAANGSVIVANETHTVVDNNDGGNTLTYANGELFWALRGGGGSTFGIVTEFTYKLHYDSKMVTLGCSLPFQNVKAEQPGEQMGKDFNHLLATSLAPEWGGYELYSGGVNPSTASIGAVSLYLNHYGEYGSPTFNTILPFLSKYHSYCELKNYSSFLDYEINSKDPLYYQQYVMNVLMQADSFTDGFYQYVYELVSHPLNVEGGAGCTGTLIGGNMHNVGADDTAVNPTFRTGVVSLSCGISWTVQEEAQHIAVAEKLTDGLLKYGNGTYFNEPSAHLPGWKARYWGGHYDRLLDIKRSWDPANVFSCYHCVGSDENDGLTLNPSTIVG